MKIIAVGGGAVGQVVGTHLVRTGDLDTLRIADLDLGRVKRYVNWLSNDKVTADKLDATKESAVTKLARGIDVLVNALEPTFNLSLMRLRFELEGIIKLSPSDHRMKPSN